MGFSVLSIVEIIYFISIRPYYKKTGKQSAAKPKKKKKGTELTDRNKRVFMVPKIAWTRYDTTGVDEHYIPFPYTE